MKRSISALEPEVLTYLKAHHRYTVKGRLGSGTYGDVFSIEMPDGSCTAIKISKYHKKNRTLLQETMDCIREMYGLETSNLLRGIFVTSERFACVLPRYGPALGNFTFPMYSIGECAAIMFSVGRQLMNFKGLHRDIKAANIVLPSEAGQVATLIDYSLSTNMKHSLDDAVVTLMYRPPEIIFGLPYDQSADIWSFGVVLLNVLLGYHFISGVSEELKYCYAIDIMNCFGWPVWPEFMAKVKHEDFMPRELNSRGHFDMESIISKEHGPSGLIACDLLRMILKPKPSERPSWALIMNHNFWSLKTSSPIKQNIISKISKKDTENLRQFFVHSKFVSIAAAPATPAAIPMRNRFIAIDHFVYFCTIFKASKSTAFKAYRIWTLCYGLDYLIDGNNGHDSTKFGFLTEEFAACLFLALTYNEDFRIYACDSSLDWASWISHWPIQISDTCLQMHITNVIQLTKGHWPREEFIDTLEIVSKSCGLQNSESLSSEGLTLLLNYDIFLCAIKNIEELPEACASLQKMIATEPGSILSISKAKEGLPGIAV